MKRFIPLLALLLGGYYFAFGQASKQEIFDKIEKTAGVYYAYPSDDILPLTPPPKGYTPFYISHFGRHGSRYLVNDSDYKTILDIFDKAQHNNALTPLGLDVRRRLFQIWLEAEGHGGDLAPLGIRQQRGIAERMFKAYPAVFTDSIDISMRSTVVIRCVLSMDVFSERLKELNPTLKITREASNKYMNYLNFHTKEAIAFRSASDTWRKAYEKFEQNHTKPRRLVASLFSDSSYTAKNIEPYSLMRSLYLIAGGMQNIETQMPMYDLFDKQELFDMWQIGNYRTYVNDANAAQNGGLMFENAKPLLKNILENAEKVIASKSKGAMFRFGHDGNIIPLALLLHLENCYNSITEPTDFYKAWCDFKLAPMAGNIQIVFFQKAGTNDILVKFLLHEKETLIPTVGSDILPYYHWKDIADYYRSLLAK